MNRTQILSSLGIVLLLALAACTSKPSPVRRDKRNPVGPTNNTADHFDGGSYCVQDFIEGAAPAQPLHLSNQITESDQTLKSKDFQADLSGDTLDIVHRDQFLVIVSCIFRIARATVVIAANSSTFKPAATGASPSCARARASPGAP